MKNILRLGTLVLVLICLYPPWVQDDFRGPIRGSEPLGYSWIFRPPMPKIKKPQNFDLPATGTLPAPPEGYEAAPTDSFARQGISVRLDLPRLSFQILALAALLGFGLSFTLKKLG